MFPSVSGLFIVSTAVTLAIVAAQEEGISVSHHDGDIDWAKVKATGIKFGVAQATEGSTFEDPTFLKNWQGMKQHQIKASASHYLIGNQTASSQVENIKKVLKKSDFNGNDDVFAISVEVKDNENVTADGMAGVLQEVITGLKPTVKRIIVHTGPYFWKHRVSWKNYDFTPYNLWVDHYSGEKFLKVPDTWKDKGYALWQYSLFGQVDGVKGSVSRIRSNDTLWLAKPSKP